MLSVIVLSVVAASPNATIETATAPRSALGSTGRELREIEVSHGAGFGSAFAFQGLEVAYRPFRYFSAALAVGVGPASTNPPPERYCLFCFWSFGDMDTVEHLGPTPWRFTASTMARVPVSDLVEFSGRLSLMRNPGAIWLERYSESDGDASGPSDLEHFEKGHLRPTTWLMGVQAGASITWDHFFVRLELGYNHAIHEQEHHEGQGLSVDRSTSPQGLAGALSWGVKLF